MSLVFISHASVEGEQAEALVTRLEESGLKCWMAPRDILPGQSYAEAIMAALEKSDAMVVVFSTAADSSVHVQREVERFLNLGRMIIPFRIEDVVPTRSMDYYLSSLQWVDAFEGEIELKYHSLTRRLEQEVMITKPEGESVVGADLQSRGDSLSDSDGVGNDSQSDLSGNGKGGLGFDHDSEMGSKAIHETKGSQENGGVIKNFSFWSRSSFMVVVVIFSSVVLYKWVKDDAPQSQKESAFLVDVNKDLLAVNHIELESDFPPNAVAFSSPNPPGKLDHSDLASSKINSVKDEPIITASGRKPDPAKTLVELMVANPKIVKILPALPELLVNSKESPFFEKLYANKATRLKTKSMSKYDYYDCQTMLEMKHPTSGRRVFFMQANMDAQVDCGSDGDRFPIIPEKQLVSKYYQPFTSYGWDKVGNVENPLLPRWRKLLAEAKSKTESSSIQEMIEDMEKRSFLVSAHDPFITISVDMLRERGSPYSPSVGDYVVVIYEEKIFPAIVGDASSTFKVGEGSLRIAKEIHPEASFETRAVSDVSVTYLIFPGTSDGGREPDYEEWRDMCEGFLKEIGGIGGGYQLHSWKDTFPETMSK